jgi:hypothetical protein
VYFRRESQRAQRKRKPWTERKSVELTKDKDARARGKDLAEDGAVCGLETRHGALVAKTTASPFHKGKLRFARLSVLGCNFLLSANVAFLASADEILVTAF